MVEAIIGLSALVMLISIALMVAMLPIAIIIGMYTDYLDRKKENKDD